MIRAAAASRWVMPSLSTLVCHCVMRLVLAYQLMATSCESRQRDSTASATRTARLDLDGDVQLGCPPHCHDLEVLVYRTRRSLARPRLGASEVGTRVP